MFTAKSIHVQTDKFQRLAGTHEVIEGALLGLDVKDKNDVEFHDLDIVKVMWPENGYRYPMMGVVRYHGGRFEIVCPWKAAGNVRGVERFVAGLNKIHEIKGNYGIEEDRHLIEKQMEKTFEREGGILG